MQHAWGQTTNAQPTVPGCWRRFKNEHPDEYFAYLITDKIIGTFDENDQKIIDYITY